MQQRVAGDYGFPADYTLPEKVFASSGDWGRRQRDAVAHGFTHVLVEAERSMFGVAFDGVLRREIAWLRSRGLCVALCSHGTDLRLPSRHAQIDEWSPFRDPTLDQNWVRALEARTLRNRRMGESLGLPLFVTTPELLLDWPSARWLPVIVESERWRTENEPLRRKVPIVLHAPTNPLVKGTTLIEPVLERMAAEGLLDYQRIIKVPASEMPERFAAADIVLDQFAIGSYGTTSIEAMAAGRLVIAHLHDQVREHIRTVTGREVPIVEATPATLEHVLRDIIARPEHYREIARLGPGFADAVHDGRLSAEVLAPFLGGSGHPVKDSA
ncbi:hypothetical protein [Microbacterium sp. A93]|uniref:hypothetical protein n=1 Tax=Microbacterium sp. A93 TaxID=3450716 RepID=UPI003F425911